MIGLFNRGRRSSNKGFADNPVLSLLASSFEPNDLHIIVSQNFAFVENTNNNTKHLSRLGFQASSINKSRTKTTTHRQNHSPAQYPYPHHAVPFWKIYFVFFFHLRLQCRSCCTICKSVSTIQGMPAFPPSSGLVVYWAPITPRQSFGRAPSQAWIIRTSHAEMHSRRKWHLLLSQSLAKSMKDLHESFATFMFSLYLSVSLCLVRITWTYNKCLCFAHTMLFYLVVIRRVFKVREETDQIKHNSTTWIIIIDEDTENMIRSKLTQRRRGFLRKVYWGQKRCFFFKYE